jgi:hypothetical protein
MSIQDRATGAVMGALIGEALGVGPHWYYDLGEMRVENAAALGVLASQLGKQAEISP